MDECKPLFHGSSLAEQTRAASRAPPPPPRSNMAPVVTPSSGITLGRGLHSFASQLNLSCV